jgi:hypothetical protein
VEIVIVIGCAAALAAGFAQAVAHQYAQRHRWRLVQRYVAGLTIINIAAAFPLFAALTIEQAVTLYGLLWLIGGVSGLATWICHESDPKDSPQGATPEADEMIRKLNEELDQ